MSLDNINLPPLVLQQLFTHTLIEAKNNPTVDSKSTEKPFLTLGNNHKKVLILVESEETLYLPDNQLNFLLGILAACNLTMEDVAILNIKKNPSVNYQLITTELQSEKVFFRLGKLKCRVEMKNMDDEIIAKGEMSGMLIKTTKIIQ